jgi:hypothetical protein
MKKMIWRGRWMNIFKKSLEELLANDNLPVEDFDTLPCVPDRLSVNDTAYALSISIQTVERMIDAGDLTLSADGNVLKSGLKEYISCHALADFPVLDNTETQESPVISRHIPDKN